MQKCTNCGTLNNQEATQCKRCKMKGHLIPASEDYQKDISSIVPQQKRCGNCGKTTSVHASKCIHCRFPIKFLIIKMKETYLISPLKTGTV